MKGSLNRPEMKEITPEYVIQLGKEWFDAMLDLTPDEELLSRPKLEHLLVQKLQDGRQEGEARILTRQLQHRFGTVPAWANKKIATADLHSLEAWSLRVMDAQSLKSVFTDPV